MSFQTNLCLNFFGLYLCIRHIVYYNSKSQLPQSHTFQTQIMTIPYKSCYVRLSYASNTHLQSQAKVTNMSKPVFGDKIMSKTLSKSQIISHIIF